MHKACAIALLVASLGLVGGVAADTPNQAALRAQFLTEGAMPADPFSGAYEGLFHFIDGRESGSFTIALQPDGPGRWKGTTRDLGGPQAKVVVTFDGLVFQMSKQYPKNRPEGYSEWVFYTGTVKVEPTGVVRVVGAWSIVGLPNDWGYFEIAFGA